MTKGRECSSGGHPCQEFSAFGHRLDLLKYGPSGSGHRQSLAASWNFEVLSCRMGRSVMAFGLNCALAPEYFLFFYLEHPHRLTPTGLLPPGFSTPALLLIRKDTKAIYWATGMELAELSSRALTLPYQPPCTFFSPYVSGSQCCPLECHCRGNFAYPCCQKWQW